MPKTEIDYSNTIIYKITCKNTAITDVYVGHTTNFVQRKHAHKQNCNSEKSSSNKCKLYEVIRANGGWSNWHMEIINFFNCADSYEARKKEQEYFVALNATLNSVEPLPKPKAIDNSIILENPLYNCETCHTNCNNLKEYEKHTMTRKHQKLTNPNENLPKKKENFVCEICDFKCGKPSNYKYHLATPKHKKLANLVILSTKNGSKIFECEFCNHVYKHASTLSAHRKKCKKDEPPSDQDYKMLTGVMMELMKNTFELQKQMLEFCKIK